MSLIRLILLALVAGGASPAASAAKLPEVTLAPRQAGTLRIAIAGDTGKGTDALAKGVAAVHAAKPLDAILLAGDTFYPCGVTAVTDPRWSLVRPLTRIGAPIFPVLGNHDYCGDSDPRAQIRATGTIPRWRFPARQYVLRTGVADFAFLDTTPFVRGAPDELTPALRAAFRKTSAPWRIVVGHHPVISSGYHGYFPRSEVKRMRALIPALREVGAGVFIGGHDHHVELIRGRMLHIISGAGSHPIPPIKLRTTTVFPPEIRLERIGFAVAEITPKEVRVRFYDANGRARSEWLRHTRRK